MIIKNWGGEIRTAYGYDHLIDINWKYKDIILIRYWD